MRRHLPAPPPMFVTKRLVAHVPPDPNHGFELRYGPRDGDPVGIPTPCARLTAGYWCSCGSGFASIAHHEQIARARVEPAPDGDWSGYIDGAGDSIEPGVHWPAEHDRRALQEQVEALPIGTIVERYGIGIAPRFGEPVDAGPRWLSADGAS